MQKIKEFHAVSRISFKQKTVAGDVFYTFEFGETVEGNFEINEEYEKAKEDLWSRVDNEITKKCKEVTN